MVKEREEGKASIAAKPSMSLFSPLLFLFFLLLLCSPCCSAQEGNLTSDALALLDFKNNLTLTSPRTISQLASWNKSSIATVCTSWFNVNCSSSSSSSNQSRVSELHLPGRALSGHIAPDTVGRLDALHTLSLRSNRLSGSLPLDLVNLSALRKLYLQGNDFSGSLPSNFSAWPLLEQLDVSSNNFSGSIPESLNNLTHLKSLNLQNNLLNGTIPSLDIASLATFNVSNNNLSGPVPGTLAGRFSSSSFTGNVYLCGPPLEACSSTSSPQASESKSNKLSKGAIVGIACGAAAAALLLLLLCIFLFKKRKGRRAGENASREVETRATSTGAVASEEAKRESSATSGKEGEERNKLVFIDEKKLFDLEDLLRASAEVLGKGTLGTSYKAVLEDGLIVAVKRLRDLDESRREEYRQRINGIGRLKHDNLVPLRAYYLDKEENLLVYDFMQNGSLSALLHGSKDAGYKTLDWEARMRIAATSAKGLAFLHAQDMVHGNVKSANVLLKSNLDACLADYCLFPILAFTPSALTKPIGYLAPEITDPRKLTPKADVFSFGVLLLELLTGKVPLIPSPSAPSSSTAPLPSSSALTSSSPPSAARSDDPVDLPRWVQSVVREEWTAEVFDPSLIQSGQPFNEEEMVQLLQVAMPCVLPSPDQRPTMAEVVRMIDNIRRTTDDDKSSDSYPSISENR